MLFTLSKVAGWFLQPLNFLILLQLAGLILFWRKNRKTGVAIVAFCNVMLLAIAFLPVSTLLMHPLEHSIPQPSRLPDKVDGILLVGGVRASVPTERHGMAHKSTYPETMTTFVALSRRYEGAKWVFSGGSRTSWAGSVTEAEVMKFFVKEQGIDFTRLILEDKSRNTYENAIFTKAVVQPKEGETWVLIAAAHHMPRAVAVFRKAGWNVLPYPVAYRTLPTINWWDVGGSAVGRFRTINMAIHEWVGLAAYWVTGRI